MKRHQQGHTILFLLCGIGLILIFALLIVREPWSEQMRTEFLQERWAPRLASATTPAQRMMKEAIQVEIVACTAPQLVGLSKGLWADNIDAIEGRCFDVLAARLSLYQDPAAAKALVTQMRPIGKTSR